MRAFAQAAGDWDRPRRGHISAVHGFTLLELLVVMTITALTVGAVLPAAVRWLGSAQERAWRADARAQLESLPLLARAAGQPMQWDASRLQERMPDLPPDAELYLPQPLRYEASGVASGGVVEVFKKGARQPLAHWDIEPITGRLLP